MGTGTMGTVERNLQATEVHSHAALQIFCIIVGCGRLDNPAAQLTFDRPVCGMLIIAADQFLNLVFGVIRQLIAIIAEKLDPIIFIGIV